MNTFDVTFLEPPRFDPSRTMEVVEYHFDECRRALASGHFSPAVRHAAMFAELIRVAALAEKLDRERHMGPTLMPSRFVVRAPRAIVSTDCGHPVASGAEYIATLRGVFCSPACADAASHQERTTEPPA